MTKPSPTRRLAIYALYSMDVPSSGGSSLIEGLTMSLVDDEDGYSLDMLRVSLRVGSHGVLQYRMYTPEQGVDEKAVAARNLADRVRPALQRVFATAVSDERERASLVYTCMAVELVTANGSRGMVNVQTEVADALSGEALFANAVGVMFEDRASIDAYMARRYAAA